MATSPSSLLLHPLDSASGKIIPASHQCVCSQRIQGLRVSCSKLNVRVKASRMEVTGAGSTLCNRRDIIGCSFGLSSVFIGYVDAKGAGLPPEEKPKLCDSACEKELENVPMVTTESGLQYKDIKIGAGPSPPVGFQVAANYVAMVPSGQIFDRQAC